jgi:isoleucyl-tRNA synthetase
MKTVLAAAKRGEWRALGDGRVEVAGQTLAPEEFQLRLVPKPGVACEPLASNDAIAVLDVALTPALVEEGIARDVVRGVQQARKEAGLHVSDRVRVALVAPPEWRAAIERHRDWIAEQTLATRLELVDALADDAPARHEAAFGDHSLSIGLVRAS